MKQIGGGESEGSMHRLPFVHVEAQPAQFNIQDSGKTECSGEIAALESTRPGSLCVLKEAIPESKLTWEEFAVEIGNFKWHILSSINKKC